MNEPHPLDDEKGTARLKENTKSKEENVMKEEEVAEEGEELRVASSLEEEEEGLEALWVDENEMNDTTSLSSSGTTNTASQKRGSFLFGGGKKNSASPKSKKVKKKKAYQPQVVLLTGSGQGGANKMDTTIDMPMVTTTTTTPKHPVTTPAVDAAGAAKTAQVKATTTTTKTVQNVAGEESKQLRMQPFGEEVAAAAQPPPQKQHQQPLEVVTADTISSLGFDKSFDQLQSPGVLSMSSLNEILDGPLTPTATTTAIATPTGMMVDNANVAQFVAHSSKESKASKKGLLRAMFGKKNNLENASVVSKFKRNNKNNKGEIQRFVAAEVVEDDDTPQFCVDNMDTAVVDMDARLQSAIQTAMENDETQSLQSYDGVLAHMTPQQPQQQVLEDSPSSGGTQPEKPINFDKAKPTFLAATLGGIETLKLSKSWDSNSLEANNSDSIIPSPTSSKDDSSQLDSPVSYNDLTNKASEEGTFSPPSSPSSTTDDSAVTDRYTVAAETTTRDDEDDNSSGEESYEDKYSVLPDPCSFCDSLWISTNQNQHVISASLSESPTMNRTESECASAGAVTSTSKKLVKDLLVEDAPRLDKYAELPEIVAASKSSGCSVATAAESVATGRFGTESIVSNDRSPEQKSKEVFTKVQSRSPVRGLVTGIFGKRKNIPKRVSKSKQQETPSSTSQQKVKKQPVRSFGKAAQSKLIKATPKKSILKQTKSSVIENTAPSVEPVDRYEEQQASTIVKTLAKVDPVLVISNTAALPSEAKVSTTAIAEDDTEGSSSVDEETDPLVDHIKKQQQRQTKDRQRGMDPATSVEQVVGRLQLDP